MNLKRLVGVVLFSPLWLAGPQGLADDTVSSSAPVTNGAAVAVTNGGIAAADLEQEIGLTSGVLGEDVGISGQDGITYSAPDVLVTRNGITRILTGSLRLSDGTRVMPSGSVILPGGSRMMLRPEQVLGFNGVVNDAPIVEAVIDDTDQTIGLAERASAGASRARPASGGGRLIRGTK